MGLAGFKHKNEFLSHPKKVNECISPHNKQILVMLSSFTPILCRPSHVTNIFSQAAKQQEDSQTEPPG